MQAAYPQPYRQRVRPASELISLVLRRVDVDVHRCDERGRERRTGGGNGETKRETETGRERAKRATVGRERDGRGGGLEARGAARASLLIGPITVITESFGASCAHE